MKYYGIQCKSCGCWLIRQIPKISTYRLKCTKCNKTFVLKSSSTWGLNLNLSQGYSSFAEATAFVKSKTEHLNTDFETYKRL